jgi:hypothetical protein
MSQAAVRYQADSIRPLDIHRRPDARCRESRDETLDPGLQAKAPQSDAASRDVSGNWQRYGGQSRLTTGTPVPSKRRETAQRRRDVHGPWGPCCNVYFTRLMSATEKRVHLLGPGTIFHLLDSVCVVARHVLAHVSFWSCRRGAAFADKVMDALGRCPRLAGCPLPGLWMSANKRHDLVVSCECTCRVLIYGAAPGELCEMPSTIGSSLVSAEVGARRRRTDEEAQYSVQVSREYCCTQRYGKSRGSAGLYVPWASRQTYLLSGAQRGTLC